MAISEAARNDLYNGLRELLGSERAETLMTAVPLHDLDEVATKRDIAGLRAATKADVAGLRAEFKSDLAALQKTMTNWMLTLLVAIIGAMASIGFFN